MDGIILENAELFYLLRLLDVNAVIGIDHQALFPATDAERRAWRARGEQRLVDNGRLRRGDRPAAVTPDDALAALASVIGHPQRVAISVRDTPGKGRQIFRHYLAGPLVVEHTQPDPKHHRIARVPDLDTLVSRMAEILPVASRPPPCPEAVTLDLDTFDEIARLLRAGKRDDAYRELCAHYPTAAPTLLTTLSQPELGGSVTLLRYHQPLNHIDALRSLSFLAGGGVSWAIRGDEAEATWLHIESIHAELLEERLFQLLAEVSEPDLRATA